MCVDVDREDTPPSTRCASSTSRPGLSTACPTTPLDYWPLSEGSKPRHPPTLDRWWSTAGTHQIRGHSGRVCFYWKNQLDFRFGACFKIAMLAHLAMWGDFSSSSSERNGNEQHVSITQLGPSHTFSHNYQLCSPSPICVCARVQHF